MALKDEYKASYTKNEVSANKHMSFALLFTAFLLTLVWIGYLFNVFGISKDTWQITVIVIPFLIVLLCVPMLFIKTKFLAGSKYKYFVLLLLILAISALNVIMPKHAILGWALCIAVTGHYYSPKVSRIVFVIVLVMMFVCMGFGMFLGEFDANLLSGELDEKTQTIHSYHFTNTYEDTPGGRWQYVNDLMSIGYNRFLKVAITYYLGRALFITLIFAVTVFLNKRTRLLFKSEVTYSNENEKNKTELEIAKEIQMNTLPQEIADFKDVEIVSELKAAKEVGGDLYDYVELDKNHVAVIIGDVSGKGVPAAMFMMKTITSFRDFATTGKTPSEILKQINISINKGNKSSMFVTCFLAILDKRNGKLTYANAGHNPPVVGNNGTYHFLKCNRGLILGCFKDIFIKDEEITLLPGESIILYTDGITEAKSEKGQFYGEERFLELLNKKNYTCVIELHHAIKDDIANFVQNAPQSDDVTFLTLKYRGDAYHYKEQEFAGKKENIIEIISFVSDFCKENNLPDDFSNKLIVVGDELASNIVTHGYHDEGGPIYVRLLYDIDTKEFAFTIIDKAEAFNQLLVNNQKLSGDVKNIEAGGLGLLIVKTIMDEYAYDRINGKNILFLRKNLTKTK